jgi:hypothetical protein
MSVVALRRRRRDNIHVTDFGREAVAAPTPLCEINTILNNQDRNLAKP